MRPILRGSGTTTSERYLTRLAGRTFLDLWSYPNTYIDKRGHQTGDGKELCDLLVVFGNDVLIFSDKTIQWTHHDDIMVSWKRWYKRAIEKSVDQIRGAERWLREFPDRVFLDKSCEAPLPLELPPLENRRTFGIVIANGAEGAGKEFFQAEDGTLAIIPRLRGKDHLTEGIAVPFMVGDIDPTGPFVHVFDKTSLEAVMHELDTVSDFVRYLEIRADAIREQKLFSAPSERDLLAHYLMNEDAEGNHLILGGRVPNDAHLIIPPGHYDSLRGRPEYRAKSEANVPSYTWDRLIGIFTRNVIGGTLEPHPEFPPSVKNAEQALRVMAAEDRTGRRALANTFIDAIEIAEKSKTHKYARVVISFSNSAFPDTAYVFLFVEYPRDIELKDGYGHYRLVRSRILETYGYAVLQDNPGLRRVIGLAFDGRSRRSEHGYSEDLMMLAEVVWDDELHAKVRERRDFYDVMKPERISMTRFSTQEYPSVDKETRQQRRARERRAAKERKKRERR